MIFLATRGVCPGVHVPAVHLPGCYSPSFRCKQSVDLLDRKGSKWRSQRAHFKQLELVSSVLLATDVGKKPIADTDIVYIYICFIYAQYWLYIDTYAIVILISHWVKWSIVKYHMILSYTDNPYNIMSLAWLFHRGSRSSWKAHLVSTVSSCGRASLVGARLPETQGGNVSW